ncbi:hypothetical protein B0F90DRAFT_634887 [Multifurca ochricompacta]|uniref:DUF6535 domain-containing protein n=1 Tax=Multifurca ochricompacta TaxID=376703 RepID=A0AAD4M201_9AGAM|nr:hypothetical protein B0F90DRAFT_634887 [Multifurca ochricompacta]
MYLGMAEEEDMRMAESWKADADGILVFAGLFSATVATLISISIQDIHSNSSNISPPPKYAVWVNTLWFLSLLISLTCALLATLLQQWARRYLKVTRPRYSPHKRARIRAFFAEGVNNLYLTWTVEALPILSHLSLFLFFAGLLVYIFHINYTIFKAVAWWVILCGAIYLSIAFVPVFRRDSPYYSPLSTPAWFLVTGTKFLVFRTLQWVTHHGPFSQATRIRVAKSTERYRKWFLQGLLKAAEEIALRLPSEIDGRSLKWTFDSLDEDHEFERFIAGIPGFCSSNVVFDPVITLIKPNGEENLAETLVSFLERTFSSGLVPESARRRRAALCAKAMHAASLPINSEILKRAISEDWVELLNSVEFGLFLSRAKHRSGSITHYARCIVAIIIASSKEHDDRWFKLAMTHLDVQRPVVEKYLAHGDSMSLANLVHIIRNILDFYHDDHQSDWVDILRITLERVSRFDAQNILPELRRDFCDLWNQILQKSQNTGHRLKQYKPIDILRDIRHLYIALHRGTDAAPIAFSASTSGYDPILSRISSYPRCNVQGLHPSDSTLTPHVSGGPTPAVATSSVATPHGGCGGPVPTTIPPPVVSNMASLSFPVPVLCSTTPVNTPLISNAYHAQPVYVPSGLISLSLTSDPAFYLISPQARLPPDPKCGPNVATAVGVNGNLQGGNAPTPNGAPNL